MTNRADAFVLRQFAPQLLDGQRNLTPSATRAKSETLDEIELRIDERLKKRSTAWNKLDEYFSSFTAKQETQR